MADGQETQLGGLFGMKGGQPHIKSERWQVSGWPRRGPVAGGWLKAILSRRDENHIPTRARGGPRERSAVDKIHACDSPMLCFTVLFYWCF